MADDKELLSFTPEPDPDLFVHGEGAIKLLCSAYLSHEAGIPEWIKNASDEYFRVNAPESRRVIVIIFQDGRGSSRPASISCLDFSGMPSAVIESNFRHWADPDAARRGQDVAGIQGGHGNGGKCYMTQMFDLFSGIFTVSGGKGNKYGVAGGTVRFGYFPDRATGRDYEVRDARKELDKVLARIGCSVSKLPGRAQQAFSAHNGFTLVMGVGPKGTKNKIKAQKQIESLCEHPEMMVTLQTCSVYVMANGIVLNEGKPLSISEVTPMPGAEKPREIDIPEILVDPASVDDVSTTNGGKSRRGKLLLMTSAVSMRRSLRGRHLITYRSSKSFIGFREVSRLGVQSPFSDRIYGECKLDALEECIQNRRTYLAESPLSRAVEQFISERVQEYASEFEDKQRQHYDQQAKNEISKMNEALDKWKNRFLSELSVGTWGTGTGTPPPPPPLPVGVPAKITVSISHTKMGLGVSCQPRVKFYDANGRRIRPTPFHWVSENPDVAEIDQKFNVIISRSVGNTVLYVETIKNPIRSNLVPIEVVDIRKITLSPSECTITAGGHFRLTATCKLDDHTESSDVLLIWTENDPQVVRVSAAGMAYGAAPGETSVHALDDKAESANSVRIKVIEGKGKTAGKEHGKGYPRILVSGEIDRDPDTNEFVHFSSDDPPIYQRPQDADKNIWWINSASPLAKFYLDEARGYGYKSQAWRMYHVERYIEAITQIALEVNPDLEGNITIEDVVLNWGSTVAEIQNAAAADLSGFITTGTLPEAP